MKNTYYFIAIGGIGMSGLAKYLAEAGCTVMGSDVKRNRNIIELEKLGAKIFIGHDENNLPSNCTPENCIIIASSVIKEDNPELKKAKELGLKILHRSDMLAEISNGLCGDKKKFFIGYSGTHGKTTTSGLCSYVLEKAGLKPSFVVGGLLPEFGINSNSGNGDYFVAELDESDGTIVKYQPEISVINNLEVDHVDFYTNGLKSILETFKKYLSTLPLNAKILANNDNSGVNELINDNKDKKFITFGLENADYVAKNIKLGLATSFDIYYKNEFLISLTTQMPGLHNVLNTMAVLASLKESGLDLNLVKEHFSTFTGMGRRMQVSAKFDEICVYDDYAHHPTEIKATLAGIKAMGCKNVIAVFQPHRYSRFAGLWDDFLNAFDDVDSVYITDVYAASEMPLENANPENFAKELSKKVPCKYLKGSIQEVAAKLLPNLEAGDLVVGLGAGTITTLGKDLQNLKNGVTI